MLDHLIAGVILDVETLLPGWNWLLRKADAEEIADCKRRGDYTGDAETGYFANVTTPDFIPTMIPRGAPLDFQGGVRGRSHKAYGETAAEALSAALHKVDPLFHEQA